MIIKKDVMDAFLRSLMGYDIYGPVGESFEKIKSFSEVNLNEKTVFSAKKIFFPSEEELFSFSGNRIKTRVAAKNIIIFGLRPCDMNAVEYMDSFFGEDFYYMQRRKRIVIFGLQCNRCFKNCFCHLTNTYHSNYYDALFIESGDRFFIDVKTDIAKKILGKMKHESKMLGEREIAELIEVIKKNFHSERSLKINDEVTKKFAKGCFSCCACTNVCPTCTCFDIKDVMESNDSGKRIREWDSCQAQNFTRVAGDFVFRPDRFERVKQRVYCKFDYTKKRSGRMSCVGCGRCVDVCPKNIDIFEVFR